MRFILLAFLSLLPSIQAAAQTSTLTLKGRIENDKIYVQNPGSSTHDGFCTKYVMVNGKKIDLKVNQSTYEIDLAEYGYKKRDSVCVQIVHEADCKPKILKTFTEEIKTPLFETESITVDTSGNLKWSTKNENYKLKFIIEQYRWNKWIKVGEVAGKGTSGKHTYEFKVEIHSGVNKIRVKQVYPDPNKTSMTPSAMCISTRSRVTMKKIKTDLLFSYETSYEVYDSFGTFVKRGKGAKLDCKTLKKGTYFVNFDNYSEKVVLK
ncbi:MAG: hypothetical protein ACHQF2_03450 [Flavobacteriales bacterium]